MNHMNFGKKNKINELLLKLCFLEAPEGVVRGFSALCQTLCTPHVGARGYDRSSPCPREERGNPQGYPNNKLCKFGQITEPL